MSPVKAPAPLGQRERLVEMIDVDKSFGAGLAALRSMSLAVDEGDFLSLLGPSGCGKSTALRLIAGLSEPSSGTIRWAEGPLEDHRISVVFQEPTLMPWATVAQNVYLPFRLAGRGYPSVRDEIIEALRMVGLEAFRDAYPRELSGGMKMRVSIARALVTRPRLILMDEPFAALDEITRFGLNDDLLKMKAALGCTVVFVTHSVFESVFLSDRIAIMAARPGRIVNEIRIKAPYPRREDFRATLDYAAQCRAVSAALRRAMEEAA